MITNFDELPIMLSVKEAADVLGVSSVTLYKSIERGKDSFPIVQFGRRKLVPKEQLKQWIDSNCSH